MLSELLRIKELRRDTARTDVNKANIRLESDVNSATEAKKELAEYDVWRIVEEDRLFDEVKGKNTSTLELTFMRQNISQLHSRKAVLQNTAQKADSAVVVSQECLEEARKKRMKAERKVQKYEETIRVMNEDEEREKQRQADLEMEEFSPKSPLKILAGKPK